MRNLWCCLGSALGLVVAEFPISLVRYCWMVRLGALANDRDVWVPKLRRQGSLFGDSSSCTSAGRLPCSR